MPKSQVLLAETFGEFFRKKRIEKGLTLRAFCRKYRYDPANISRLERGKLSPPEDEQKLEAYALALGIDRESPDWVTFLDLAYTTKGKIPPDITAKSPEIVKSLPAFFRTIRGEKINQKTIKTLVDLIKRS